MKILHLLAAGVVLTVIGLIYTYLHWSLAAFMTPVCSGHWYEYANCRSVAWRARAGWVSPLPGLILVLIAIVRFVRWWRAPVCRPGAAHSRATR
ncbi:MAG: hypothetical protein HYV09_21970 [Deltaproteobacteria bacterium]|nr:hypothetical protein [Deltaproteobacteria bacterium]